MAMKVLGEHLCMPSGENAAVNFGRSEGIGRGKVAGVELGVVG